MNTTEHTAFEAAMLSTIEAFCKYLRRCGYTITITQESLPPLAMGHTRDVVTLQPSRAAEYRRV